MQPIIMVKDELLIAGLSGIGSDTGAVWAEFDKQYKAHPFSEVDENGYEVRFDSGGINVGFSVPSADGIGGFSAFSLPAAEYAVFDVLVANGYDSENTAMDQWLADNADTYSQLELDGRKYVVEFYGEKFRGGNQPDSVVEIWIPLVRRDSHGQ